MEFKVPRFTIYRRYFQNLLYLTVFNHNPKAKTERFRKTKKPRDSQAFFFLKAPRMQPEQRQFFTLLSRS